MAPESVLGRFLGGGWVFPGYPGFPGFPGFPDSPDSPGSPGSPVFSGLPGYPVFPVFPVFLGFPVLLRGARSISPAPRPLPPAPEFTFF